MGECKHIVVSRLIAISSPQSVQTDASKDDEIVRYKSPDFTPQEAKIVHSCRLEKYLSTVYGNGYLVIISAEDKKTSLAEDFVEQFAADQYVYLL